MVHSFHPLRGISRVSRVGSGKPDKALKLVLSTSTSLRNEISNQQVDYLNYDRYLTIDCLVIRLFNGK